MKTRNLLTMLLLFSLCVARGALADDSLYQQVLRSTVWIVTDDGSGSGVLVDADRRLVVTNYHVVASCDEVKVCFPDNREGAILVERAHYQSNLEKLAIRGEVAVVDPQRDLALIKLDSLPESARALPIAEQSPAPGDAVHSIGNPGTSHALWVYTSGTVRQIYDAKMCMPNGIPLNARIMETQAPINCGDSGGPAFNQQGELIGIVQSYQSDAQLISRCIEVSEVRALLSGEIKTWDVRVSQGLDAEQLRYSVNPYGLFRVSFQDDDEDRPTVILIDSVTNQLRGSEIRELRVQLFTSSEPLPAALANELLRRNSSYIMGAWCIYQTPDAWHLVFVVRLDANASSSQLRDAIGHMLAVAHGETELLEQISAAQSVDQDKLVGTWVGQGKNDDGEAVRIHLVFTATGAFSIDDETYLARGSYRLVDGAVEIEIGGKRRSLGPARLADSHRLTLNLGDGDVVLTRSPDPATLTADHDSAHDATDHAAETANLLGQGG